MNLARRTMNAPALAAIYEKAWRPALFYLASGRTTAADRRDAVTTLRLDGSKKVLDIACGPGNFTRYLSNALDGDGFAIGLDYSAPMLARAVTDNGGPRVGYLRGDARTLPFADGTFDAVCCFGALYLIPDPIAATREMIRVLTPAAASPSPPVTAPTTRPAARAVSSVAGADCVSSTTRPSRSSSPKRA